MNKEKLAVSLKKGKKPLLMASVVALTFGCHKQNVDQKDLKNFEVVNLVANSQEYRPRTTLDPTLINAFGSAWSPNGIAWVNSAFGHVSELYKSEGEIARPPVNIPSTTDSVGGFPLGIVFAGGKNFKLGNGKALFIFSSFDGVISAWNGGNNATRILAPNGASFTGLAIASSGPRNFIYGANFGKNRIDVWDTLFHKIPMDFKDDRIPPGYSPYNIQAVGDYLFVMYAIITDTGALKGRPTKGNGFGFVDVFTNDGQLVKRFASNGTLNAPWGVTMAPASFLDDQDMTDGGSDNGGYGDKSFVGGSNKRGNNNQKDPVILIGNFGDGKINVFTQDGQFIGQLKSHNHTLEIEGLWSLTFPPASANIDPRRLYFTAGPSEENDGVFGYLIKQ